ncbi:MAG: hypothetical protein WBI05_14080 [Rhodoferax sp.]|uniref:hypothetical protein n=1 Tax=Rhodoferax sp. TaxID=50421 RepID=UPI003C767F03
MRTAPDSHDDVLFAAKELARRAFATPPLSPADTHAQAPSKASERLATYGIHPLPRRGGVVSNELIDRLRDAEGI